MSRASYSCGCRSMGSALRYLCRKAKSKLRPSNSGKTISLKTAIRKARLHVFVLFTRLGGGGEGRLRGEC